MLETLRTNLDACGFIFHVTISGDGSAGGIKGVSLKIETIMDEQPMRSTLKTTALVLISFFLINMSSVALAWSVADRVHVVFGSGSSADVLSGYIVAVGSGNSKWNGVVPSFLEHQLILGRGT